MSELLLHPHTRLRRLEELPAGAREGLPERGWLLTRDGARGGARVVDDALAGLLEHFREPATVVAAVRAFAAARGLVPKEVLRAAHPELVLLARQGHLVGERPAERDPLAIAAAVPGVEPLECLVANEDTAVLRVRRGTEQHALKLALEPHRNGALAREREVLALATAHGAVPAVDHGEVGDLGWLLLAWAPGREVGAAAAVARQAEDRPRLRAIVAALLDAYAGLHEAGIVHGDVHAGNAFVDGDACVRLIDFELAVAPGLDVPSRGSAPYQTDPGMAAAELAGRPAPDASAASDRYALGSVIFELACGRRYLSLGGPRPDALRRIVEETPERAPGDAAIADVAALLLAKDEAARAALDLRVLASSVREAPHRSRDLRAPASSLPPREPRALADRVVAEAEARLDQGLPQAPRTSVTYGSAGLVWSLLRRAELEGGAGAAALARAWSARMLSEAGRDDAYFSIEPAIDAGSVGTFSPFHSESGVHLVAAAVEAALGDPAAATGHADRFCALAAPDGRYDDLLLGAPGSLLGAALLLARLPGQAGLLAFGDRVSGEIAARRSAPVDGGYVGIAHGVVGSLFAELAWHRVTGRPLAPDFRARVDSLCEHTLTAGPALVWPRRVGPTDAISGWCNGTAGAVLLLAAAAEAFGDAGLAHLAERSGRHVWDEPTIGRSLCCGAAGQAYAMLAVHRVTSDAVWLDRARRLADTAAACDDGPDLSLHKGGAGVAVLTWELEEPDAARFPLVEP